MSQCFTADNLRDEIEQRRAEGMKLFAERNLDGLVSYFTPDATLMFPGSENIQGESGMPFSVNIIIIIILL